MHRIGSKFVVIMYEYGYFSESSAEGNFAVTMPSFVEQVSIQKNIRQAETIALPWY